MTTALIKFTQGVSVGDGRALKGSTGTAVQVGNSDNTGVGSWEIELLEVPYSSVVAVGVLASGDGAAPIANFTPDVGGGCYRVMLTVWPQASRQGTPDVDIRNFGVNGSNGLCAPPPQVWPLPLPDPRTGRPGAKPNEMNFGGQDDGWAGSGNDGLLRHAIRVIAGAIGSGDIKSDGSVPFAANQSMGGHKITSLQAGTATGEAVNYDQLLAAIAAQGGGGDGFVFTFDASTADADPGNGKLRFNNATPSLVTQMYVDLLDVFGNDLTAWLDHLDDTTSSVKGYIRVESRSDHTRWGLWSLTSVTTVGGYRKLNLTFIGGTASLPTTTASDTFLSFEALGFTGQISTGSIADDAVTFAKMQNIATASLIGRATAGTGDPENITLDTATLGMSGGGLQVLSQLGARGSENVVIDLYPSLQQQGTIGAGATVNFNLAIAVGRAVDYTIRVVVNDGAGGSVLFKKTLVLGAENVGGTAALLSTDEGGVFPAAGWSFSAAASGANIQVSLTSGAGVTRTYNVIAGAVATDKP